MRKKRERNSFSIKLNHDYTHLAIVDLLVLISLSICHSFPLSIFSVNSSSNFSMCNPCLVKIYLQNPVWKNNSQGISQRNYTQSYLDTFDPSCKAGDYVKLRQLHSQRYPCCLWESYCMHFELDAFTCNHLKTSHNVYQYATYHNQFCLFMIVSSSWIQSTLPIAIAVIFILSNSHFKQSDICLPIFQCKY